MTLCIKIKHLIKITNVERVTDNVILFLFSDKYGIIIIQTKE
jgi:hypothetical protein